ncbi:MAG TPA: hypothetical protein DDY13_04485 [Cytophagales bacterium]|jgi:hypothetical protein|nr:hypothetical protein [Cytophagales bacterium]
MLERLTKIKTYPIRQSPIPAFKNKLKQYVDQLPLTDHIRQFLADETFIDQNPGYYTHYPFLFCKNVENAANLKHLTIAGFLYYKSVIILDDLFDNDKVKTQSFLIASICQEESIKILTSLFGLKSKFWSYLNQRKAEYSLAIKQDKDLILNTSLKAFEKQADCKSAFGKVAIDALRILGYLNEDDHELLTKSHKYYYAAFQILDDIDDFKEDLKIEQYNIAVSLLRKEMVTRGMSPENHPPYEQSKLIYLMGIAEKLLDQAIEYLHKSEQLIPDNGFENWRTEINKFHNLVISRKLNIQGFIKKTQISLKLSKEIMENNISLENQVNKGLKFIFANQNEYGSWNEYFNDAGMSDTWATGFILSYLHEFDTKNGLIRSNIQKGCNFLLNTKEDLLWGYNQSWIEDTDSSTFALLALSNHELFPIKSFHSWLSLQKSSGGFSTYFDEKALASSINKEIDYNVDGWIKDHVCVSAAALYLLSILKSDQSIDKQRLALINFIKKAQLSSGLWESYWWTSPIYSTTYIIKAATRLDDKALKNAVEKSLNGLFELQNSNGSFGDQFTEESPFYTGLVVEACCSSISYFEAFKNEIEIAVDWLRNNQTTDGTWKGTPALRMPSPEITTPEDISTWIEETKGLNIRVNEINRLFSTVVCTTSISKYYDISS